MTDEEDEPPTESAIEPSQSGSTLELEESYQSHLSASQLNPPPPPSSSSTLPTQQTTPTRQHVNGNLAHLMNPEPAFPESLDSRYTQSETQNKDVEMQS